MLTAIDTLVTLALALGTAIAFAVSTLLVRQGVERSDPMAALLVTLSVNVVLLWTVSAPQEMVVDLGAWKYFIIAGLFAPGLGRLCNYTGIRRLGVTISYPISNTNPMIAVVIALLVLDASLSSFGIAGATAVVAGGILVGSASGGTVRSVRWRAIVFPVLAAVFFGGAQVLREAGLAGPVEPTVGAAVNSTTSLVLLGGYVLLTGRHRALTVSRRDGGLFVVAGIVSSIGTALLYVALRSGSIVIVAPILNTSPLFALLISYHWVHERELFSPRVVLGTMLIVCGVTTLALVR